MNSNLILDASVNLISILFELILLGVFINYVLKRKSLDGILLLTSAILSILIRPIMYFGYNYLPHDATNLRPIEIFEISIKIYGILNSALFTIGLILLVIKQTKRKTSEINTE